MVIRVHDPRSAVGNNRGSVESLVDYLDKENTGKDELEKEHFFNRDGSHFSAAAVQRDIDNNKAKLKKTDTKFYMITVNPSQSELRHIGGDEEKFKAYINDLMDKYADNFNRSFKDGRELSGSDILYYAKIEHERTYKFNERAHDSDMRENRRIELEIARKRKTLGEGHTDQKRTEKEIKALEARYIRNAEGTIIKEGNPKDGNNLHAHIIVSRLDRGQQMQLSPMSNHRSGKNTINGREAAIGFDRDRFVAAGEQLFDQKFSYSREYHQSYGHYKEAKQIRSVGNLLHLSNPEAFAKMAAKRAIREMVSDRTLQKQLGMAMSGPRKLPGKTLRHLEKKAIEGIMEKMGAAAYTNPATAGVQLAKQIISMALTAVEKGITI